jgi:hypothetical protein
MGVAVPKVFSGSKNLNEAYSEIRKKMLTSSVLWKGYIIT